MGLKCMKNVYSLFETITLLITEKYKSVNIYCRRESTAEFFYEAYLCVSVLYVKVKDCR